MDNVKIEISINKDAKTLTNKDQSLGMKTDETEKHKDLFLQLVYRKKGIRFTL